MLMNKSCFNKYTPKTAAGSLQQRFCFDIRMYDEKEEKNTPLEDTKR